MKQTVCIFDIETIPDTKAFKRLHQLEPSLADGTVFAMMQAQRRAQTGHDFMHHHLHRIVAIAACVYLNGKHKVASLGQVNDDEKTVVERFFHLIDTYQPVLISWNGGGFDLPVLHYRALFHGISAPTYWDVGHFDSQHKWSNYLARFQWRHIDMMDVIAGYQARAAASLNDVAKCCGFPGKLATDGAAVLTLYQAGDMQAIRNYCETDVLNTYLVYLRFELMRGLLTSDTYHARLNAIRDYLRKQQQPHFQEFLNAWNKTNAQ